MSEQSQASLPVRVLVIEDNEDDQELLRHQLRKSGMENYVRFIADGREALNFLTGATTPGDLVALFLDLRLPSLNGVDLLRNLRLNPGYQELPVIVMTSSNDPRDLEECRKLGVTHYVSKPISFSSFSKAVANIFHPPKPDAVALEGI